MKVFYKRDLHHLCKISSDGSVIFYTSADCLVFYTIVMIYAVKYGVRITNFCIMRNHFHIAVYADKWENISKFIQQICAQYVGRRNELEGKIKISFKRGIGRSDKYEDKTRRDCQVYVSNNPVEKRQCSRAGEYRWNFLSYADDATPESCIPDNASEALLVACSIVRTDHKGSLPIGYNFFDHFSSVLSADEYRALEDYVIRLYNVIDWSEIKHYYGSIEGFKAAAAASKGADYDMSEEHVKEVYTHYDQLSEVARRLGFKGDDSKIHEPGFDLFGAVQNMAYTTDASCREIARFLHLAEGVVQDIIGRRW